MWLGALPLLIAAVGAFLVTVVPPGGQAFARFRREAAPALLPMAIMGLVLGAVMRHRARQDADRCIHCGYQRDNAARCPECGKHHVP